MDTNLGATMDTKLDAKVDAIEVGAKVDVK